MPGFIIALKHPDTRPIVQIDLPAEEGYVMGRSDESSDFVPDIDLAAYDARDRGVSRRHLALLRYHGLPHLLDLSSVNGTFLNAKRLLPETPYVLETRNQVRLGTLELFIHLLE